MIEKAFSSIRTQVNKDRPGFASWQRIELKGEEQWSDICYGNGIFVAIAYSGTNRVASSTDGIYWLKSTIPARTWTSITYGKGKFIAVSYEGAIATSEDSINWTLQTPPATVPLVSVAYGKGNFKALAETGIPRVLSSADGITWVAETIPTAMEAHTWVRITYGMGNFIAVSRIGNHVMRSPGDGSWVGQSVASNTWSSICYGRGKYVAVANGPSEVEGEDQSTPRIMVSGISSLWKYVESPANINFTSVSYGDGVFVAYGSGSKGNNVIVSEDGEVWRVQRGTPNLFFMSSTYGNGLHIAVSSDGGTEGKGIKSGSGPMIYEGLALEI